MPWDTVDKVQAKVPIVKMKADEPVRIRLIEGPGKYAQPVDIWQHWPPDNQEQLKQPIRCTGGLMGQGCIFHTPPFAWRSSPSHAMNCLAYDIKDGKAINRRLAVLQAGKSIWTDIKKMSDLHGIAPTDCDWIILKTGQGKNSTKYTVTPAHGAPLDGPTIDINTLPAPEQTEFMDARYPTLIDFDEFPSIKKMTNAEQNSWLELQLNPPEDGDVKTTVTRGPALPALGSGPPSDAIDAEYKERTATPPPPPAASTPPPPPELPKYERMMDPWGKDFMEELKKPTLQYIIATPGFSEAHIAEAKRLLGGAPAPAAPAASNGHALDEKEAKAKITQALMNFKSIKEVPNARKLFKIGGGTSMKTTSIEGLRIIASLVDQGDDAVAAAIAKVE